MYKSYYFYLYWHGLISDIMKNIFLTLVMILVATACGTKEEQIIRKADRIHALYLTVDTHCDTPLDFYGQEFDLGVKHDEGCVDFPRMKEGGLDAEFFAVFIGQGPRDDLTLDAVHKKALGIFDAIHKNVANNPSLAEIAVTADDAYKLKKEGKIAAFIGLENGYPVGKNISRVKEYFDLGARYITLCHTKNNDICDSSTDPKGPEHNGLSEFGKEVVTEMNRLGMMVDVSHISDKSFYDVMKTTQTPVIASHSSCRALCENARNLDDKMLLALKENGGVIQICILSEYLKAPESNPEMDSMLRELQSKYGEYNQLDEAQKKLMRDEYRVIQNKYRKLATVKDAVDHIDHVVQVIGIDYVGIGTDFDGGGGIEGCSNVSEMKNITIELLRRGYSNKDISKIWGGNAMRVLRKAEEFAKQKA
jgi:membrane dipeptidase